MNARLLGSITFLCGGLLWALAASSGAPEAVDVDQAFGTPDASVPQPSTAPTRPPLPTPATEPVALTDSELMLPTIAPMPMLTPTPTPTIPAISTVEIPPFKALYDVKMKGIVVGELEVSLAKAEGGEWIYRQQSSSKGVASLFGPEDLVETSRFRRVGDGLQILEYRSKRKGGDADDNARFVFDHAAARVDSVGKGEPWSVKAPEGVVDPLSMTLAMRFELAKAKAGDRGASASSAAGQSFLYNVPRQGRIKTYEFGVVGVENLEVTGRSISTVHVQRLRDAKDQTSIWTAPEMDYLPVRILKTRKEGSSSEVLLRSFVRS